ncbi:hypothetical protein [Halocola ammonii]
MKKFILACLFLQAGLFLFAQDGKQFPNLPGETLEGENIELPEDTKGKVTLVGMAYSKKAESALKSWYQPMYDKFVLKRGMFDQNYDVNLYFVPMFTGLKRAAFGASMNKLKKSHRKDLFPYILFYKGELDIYEDELKMTEKNQPYFFVLDEEGKIVYSTYGLYSQEKMAEIEKILDKRW